MEGQAGTWMLYGKKRRKYLVYSRNTPRNPKGFESWGRISERYELEKNSSFRERKLCYPR